jgi:hypothetical protein
MSWFFVFICKDELTADADNINTVRRHVSSRKHFLCPEILLPVGLIAVLFGTSSSGYAFLNASRTAANDLDAKKCSRMNTRSDHEYTMFAPAQLLRS